MGRNLVHAAAAVILVSLTLVATVIFEHPQVFAQEKQSYEQVLRSAEEFQMLPSCRELTQSHLSNNISQLTLPHLDKPCDKNCVYQGIIDQEGRQIYLLLKRTCKTGNVFWFCLPCLEDGATKTLQLRLIDGKPQVMGQVCPECK